MSAELLAGRYELVAPVGKGATGQVWRGLDTLLERQVAIKMVDFEGARDPAMAERFRREGIAIAGVRHDAIVQVFDTGADDRRGWLVMEYLNGPNLNKIVQDAGPLAYEIGMPLLARVADGLQAAHDAGITHRDVKPANIVLDAAPDAAGTIPDLVNHPELGRPVLVDFGIARLVDQAGTQLTRPATAIGTAAYMSPEQARGLETGPASDVYSLACVAYHAFLGRPPFTATSSVAVAHAQAYDTPVPLAELSPDVPPALNSLVTRMLLKDAGQRPSAREVAAELRAITNDPGMAPTAVLAGLPAEARPAETATAVLPPQAAAASPTATLADGMAAVGPVVPVAAAATTGRPSPSPAPAEEETLKPASGGGFHNAGRWLVALLVLGLVAALVYTWTARGSDSQSVPTVTMFTTAPQTSASRTTTRTTHTTGRPTTVAPTVPTASTAPTTSVPIQSTTAPPATTQTQATQAPTTAAPTTAEVPATTAPPATTERPVGGSPAR